MTLIRLKKLRLVTIILVTILPVLFFPTMFVRSLGEFFETKVRFDPGVVRTLRMKEDVTSFFFKFKLADLKRVLYYNEHAETFVSQDHWANDEVHLDIRGKKWDKLTSDLPTSGENYEAANVWDAKQLQKAKLRIRGNSDYHWSYPRRSLKIKTPKKDMMRGHRHINLSVKNVYEALLLNKIAEYFELLVPENARVKTFINGNFFAIHRFMEEIDEGFLRRHNRMPGNIFKGEGVRSTNEYHFGTKPYFLHYTPYVWPKAAVDNALEMHNRDGLVALATQVSQAGLSSEALQTYWDLEAVTNHLAYKYFVGENHSTNGNNIKLFQDPIDGKFSSIIWDPQASFKKLTFDAPETSALSIIVPIPYHKMGADPRFMHQVMQRLYEKLSNAKAITAITDEVKATYNSDKAARLTQAPHPTFTQNKKKLETRIRKIHAWRKKILGYLDKGELAYQQQDKHIALASNSHAGAKLSALIIDSKSIPVNFGTTPIIHFGKHAIKTRLVTLDSGDKVLKLNKPFLILPAYVGAGRLNIEMTAYPFTLPEAIKVTGLSATNAITQKPIHSKPVTIISNTPVDSIAPLDLPFSPEPEVIYFDYPKHYQNKDLVIQSHQTLNIKKGTEVILGEKVNIISYGKVIAQGTSDDAIVFRPKNSNKAWGVLALQGSGANGSRFTHVQFIGGTAARYARVRYPGMVDIHKASDVLFYRCEFSDNVIGDDAIRAAYSQVDLIGNRFFNTNGDAIDYDHSTGKIQNNQFSNVGNDCIDLMASTPRLIGNNIKECADKGISVGENSNPLIFNNQISNTNIGIQIKDGSNPLILNNNVTNNITGIHLYRKNWRYASGGKGVIYNSIVQNNKTDISVKGKSQLTLYASDVSRVDPKLIEKGKLITYDIKRKKHALIAAPQSKNSDIYSHFNPVLKGNTIGIIDNNVPLNWKTRLYQQRFKDGFSADAQGWSLAQQQKLYVTEQTLVAKIREKEHILKKSFTNLPKLSSHFLSLSIGSNKSIAIQLRFHGENETRTVPIDLGDQIKNIDLPIPVKKLNFISFLSAPKTQLHIKEIAITKL